MILVLGSAGQLGQELTKAARAGGIPATGLDRTVLDIAEGEAVARALGTFRPSVVINAAAYAKVDQAETEPEEAHRANATGPAVLARACAEAGVPLIHISTDYVFDGSKAGAYGEDDPVAPLGTYGRSKAEGEAAIRRILSRHVIVRTSWVYGVHGSNFLKTVLRLAAERDELRIVADQRGCPTCTVDLARALLEAARRLAAGEAPSGTYHFAGAGVATWHGLATRIVEAQRPFTGRFPRIVPIRTEDFPTLARRPVNSELDSSRFAEVFGLSARPWGIAVDETVARLMEPLG